MALKISSSNCSIARIRAIDPAFQNTPNEVILMRWYNSSVGSCQVGWHRESNEYRNCQNITLIDDLIQLSTVQKTKMLIFSKMFSFNLKDVWSTNTYNLGQRVVDKFTKLSKIDFSVGMFLNWFFAIFYRKASKFGLWVDGWILGSNPSISGIFLKFPNFLRS